MTIEEGLQLSNDGVSATSASYTAALHNYNDVTADDDGLAGNQKKSSDEIKHYNDKINIELVQTAREMNGEDDFVNGDSVDNSPSAIFQQIEEINSSFSTDEQDLHEIPVIPEITEIPNVESSVAEDDVAKEESPAVDSADLLQQIDRLQKQVNSLRGMLDKEKRKNKDLTRTIARLRVQKPSKL